MGGIRDDLAFAGGRCMGFYCVFEDFCSPFCYIDSSAIGCESLGCPKICQP